MEYKRLHEILALEFNGWLGNCNGCLENIVQEVRDDLISNRLLSEDDNELVREDL